MSEKVTLEFFSSRISYGMHFSTWYNGSHRARERHTNKTINRWYAIYSLWCSAGAPARTKIGYRLKARNTNQTTEW
jgi:hypothetical protein